MALFRNADEIFIREIVQRLTPLSFLPDDYIIRQGEYGDCMYFLSGGDVEVLIGGSRVAVLGHGSQLAGATEGGEERLRVPRGEADTAVLHGEALKVRIIQEGTEPNQGVGYLDDGTMVVVEDGRRHLDETVDVTVTKVLQTVQGRMIFAQPHNRYSRK